MMTNMTVPSAQQHLQQPDEDEATMVEQMFADLAYHGQQGATPPANAALIAAASAPMKQWRTNMTIAMADAD
uniref:Peroxin-19 n=1 Tax=Macrostomum lignano TaxID=282301 RepID=A0A1I8FN37_9PLAT